MTIFSFGKVDSAKGEEPSRSMELGTSMKVYLSLKFDAGEEGEVDDEGEEEGEFETEDEGDEGGDGYRGRDVKLLPKLFGVLADFEFNSRHIKCPGLFENSSGAVKTIEGLIFGPEGPSFVNKKALRPGID